LAKLTPQQRTALPNAKTLIQRKNQLDADSQTMIYDGCNLTQLTKIFNMDRRTIEEKIRNVAPFDTRSGYPVWRIVDVAPHLVKPAYDVENYIKRMNPDDLPPALTREYWNAKKVRQDFLKSSGELWPTAQVIQCYGKLFQTLRMSWLLTRDAIERDMVLSAAQREAMVRHMDGGLSAAAAAVEEEFKVSVAEAYESGQEI